jgi:hypothetical protein
MVNNNLGCTIFAIAAVILAMATFSNINRENFTEMMMVDTKLDGGNGIQQTMALENYQNGLIVNTGTGVEQINKQGAQYYLDLQNYLNPSLQNLELASNISARPIMGGVTLPGAANSYSNAQGDGYVNNLGYLNGSSFPPVAYSNERAAQLSKCAKDLPMFAASSLLPKPSSNADNNALSQSAAQALAAFTNLSPVEQIGAITSTKLPQSKTTSERAIPQIAQTSVQTPMFYSSPGLYITPTFGSVNSTTLVAGPNTNTYIG